jgi:putative endonuclease
MDRREVGIRGEDAAAAYLERIGMTIVERNWRVPAGEIDIIAVDGESLVMCEVKTRTTASRGTPEEAVSPTKQRRIVRLAVQYIASAGIEPCTVRFDVVSIRVLGPDRALLRHHRAAFVVE